MMMMMMIMTVQPVASRYTDCPLPAFCNTTVTLFKIETYISNYAI